MLMIRLQRVGRKNDPSFRVVVLDHHAAAKTGRVIEVVGSHDARVDRTEINADRIKHWLSMGAKTSATVNNLLIKKGIIEGDKIDVSSKKLGKKASAKAEKIRKDAELTQKKAEPAPTVTEQAPVEDIPVEEIKEEPVSTEEIKEETLTEKID